MDLNEGLKAINTICDFNREYMSAFLRNPDKMVLPTEAVRAACRLLSTEHLFPFDADADDITLLEQINRFMNSFLEEGQ